ncbi:hypothetical protein O5O45_02140 [Hahella aquimaris]|uniref:hypothetical protein n=1 Tax=Hahella sp. HNIBRBA332 TaxID=3015983 RepID=UPI00273BF55D|nr:hypothetical protein [Hahella sp. HNIBRBA332]WLQ14735.1 hypothetical protein O5O45_02140 [Hahella sp. HNIBRBA332]
MTLYTPVLTMDILRRLCGVKASSSDYQSWRTRNQADLIEASVGSLKRRTPAIGNSLLQVEEKLRVKLNEHQDLLCKTYSDVLEDDRFNPMRTHPELYAAITEESHNQRTTDSPGYNQTRQQKSAHPILLSQSALSCVSTNAGPESSVIEKIFAAREHRYNGSMMLIHFQPYTLFRNGELYRGMDAAIADLDITACKQARREDWGHWRAQGTGYQFQLGNGKPREIKAEAIYPVFPADAGETLEGTWKMLGTFGAQSVSGLSSQVFVARDITLHRNGRFELNKSAGGVSQTMVAKSDSQHSGAYRLTEYQAVFSFDDGHTERMGFFFFPNNNQKDTAMFNLGGISYTQKDE